MSELKLGGFLGLDSMKDPSSSDGSRVTKARTEPKLVVPRTDNFGYATGVYIVISDVDDADPSVYEINMTGQGGREDCDCMDMRMNHPNTGCKHIQRIGLQMTNGNLPQPDDPTDEYLSWIQDQRDALEAKRDELQQDGLEDSDDLRTLNLALEGFAEAFDRIDTDDDDGNEDDESDEESVVSVNENATRQDPRDTDAGQQHAREKPSGPPRR